jgi:hypothetical protein
MRELANLNLLKQQGLISFEEITDYSIFTDAKVSYLFLNSQRTFRYAGKFPFFLIENWKKLETKG